MTLGDLARLDAVVAEAPAGELPALVGALARLQALALARLNACGACQTPVEEGSDQLISLPEVARRLGIPEDRGYDLARQGRLPVVAVGKYRRVRESALRAFIAASETPVRASRFRRAG
jgi:excisionase family DNA binding protein